MTDVKRQTGGSKSSTSKAAGNQGPGDMDEVLSKAIGARVKLTTTAPASLTLEGTVYTVCRSTNIIAIHAAPASANPASQVGDYHIIPVSRLQSFNILSVAPAGGFEAVQPAIGRIDLKALKAREEMAIKKMKERDTMRGKGVGKEGQEIFDALARTLPTRWHETTIIVLDAVMIAKPYGLDNCSAPKDQPRGALTRVKQVLEAERKKIAERNKVAVATPLGTVKKGG